jgi:hypothetical protein
MVVEVDSAPRYLSSGVPPECIPCIRFSKFHFYDDLQIYLSGDRKDLAAISGWLAENGLLFNPRKSQAILISNYVVSMVLPSLFLGIREEIPWCDAVTDLGVVIDGRLRFDRQVTKVCSRVYVLVLPEFLKNKIFVKR